MKLTDFLRLGVTAALALALAGCQSYEDARISHMAVPPDFWMSIYVDGEHDAQQRLDRTVRFVVEPGRTLRMAASASHSPRRAGTLSPRQVEALAGVIDHHQLMVEPTSPFGELLPQDQPTDVPVYHVTIHARGKTNSYVTTAEESPPTASLLKLLWAFARGEQPPLHEEP